MIKKITNTCYHPIIYFFLLPLISIFPGSILAFQYGQTAFTSFIALYIYIVTNQLIENILLRIPTNNFQLSKRFLTSLEIVNILFLLFFGFRHSWMSAATLLLYTITIQLQFLFTYYDLEKTAAFIASFLKVILLNGIAFYIHTNFLHFRFLPYYFALFFPYFIYELTRFKEKADNKLILPMIIFSFLFTLALLWNTMGIFSSTLLLSFPFIIVFQTEHDGKYIATFLIVFSLLYMLLLSFSFI